jgi:prevent-host-death family protein
MKELIPAEDLKAKCLTILDEVEDEHKEFIITRNGTAIARLLPMQQHENPGVAGRVAGSMKVCGDLITALDVNSGGETD